MAPKVQKNGVEHSTGTTPVMEVAPDLGSAMRGMVEQQLASKLTEIEMLGWFNTYARAVQSFGAMAFGADPNGEKGLLKGVSQLAHDAADGAVRRFRQSRERSFEAAAPAAKPGAESAVETKHA